MIRLLLCDDDEVILEGIEKCIDWDQYGINVIHAVKNGRQAIEILQNEQVDLLLTDIQMPYYSGLEVVKKAYEINPDTIAIMLSGYNDFEYARKAIKLGALDFISKPIDLEELNQVVLKAVDYYNKQIRDAHRELNNVISMLINNTGDFDRKQADERFNLSQNYFQIFLMELDELRLVMNGGGDESNYENIKRYKQLTEKCRNDGMILLNYAEYGTIICIKSEEKAFLSAKTGKLMKWVKEFNDFQAETAKVTLGGSEAIREYEQLKLLRKQAEEALRFKFIKGIGSIILYENIKEYIHSREEDGFNMDSIPLPMKLKDKSEIKWVMQEVKQKLLERPQNMELAARMLMGNWLIAVSESLAEYGIDMKDLFEKPIIVYKKVTSCLDLESMMEYFEQIYTTIYDFFQTRRNGKYIDVIAMTARYIKDQYMKPGLSIEEVAEYGNMSVGYFSLIFHNETGETFSDFLVRVRMEKARELLVNTNLKLMEISKSAGYENSNYFSTVFKKYTGITPSQYRDENGKKS